MITPGEPDEAPGPSPPTPRSRVRVHSFRIWSARGVGAPEPLLIAEPPLRDPTSRSRWRLEGPLILVAVAVAFNLWVFRAQGDVVAYGNDLVVHLQMVSVAQHLLSMGRFPLGQWFPNIAQGSPFFVQYQSLSAILTGLLALVTGPRVALALTLYLLYSLWPVCVYWAGRIFGWDRWIAGVAAVVAPLVFGVTGRGFEVRSYGWAGAGLWSQLWAMWTLPLALAFCWRYISQRRYLAGAVLTLALTVAFHYLTAYLAGLAVIVFVLVRPREIVLRLRRAAVLATGVVLTSLWVTLPLLLDAKWTAINPAQVGTPVDDSYGAPTVLKWLVTGKTYDNGRYPVITILVGAGLIVCARRWRTDERARVLVGLWVLSLLLFFGRPTLGALLDLLPGNQELLFQRFVSGVQLSGDFLAGVGAVGIARSVMRASRLAFAERAPRSRASALYERFRIPAVSLVFLAFLTPAWSELRTYGADVGRAIAIERGHDQTQGRQLNVLLAYITAHGGGRTYAGLSSNWGVHFSVGVSPVYMELLQAGNIDNVGYGLWTSSLMMMPQYNFDESNIADYDAFDVHYLVLPAGQTPPVPAHLVETSGGFALWTRPPAGIVQVVDTQGSITATKSNIGPQATPFLRSPSRASRCTRPSRTRAPRRRPPRWPRGSRPPGHRAPSSTPATTWSPDASRLRSSPTGRPSSS